MKPALLALPLALLACNRPADGAKTEPRPGEAPRGAAPPTSAERGATPGATLVRECPQSLGGAETQIDRVISRECGPVKVTDDYRIDDGTLTLEAGAALHFKDGAALIVGEYQPAKLIVQGTADAPVTFTSAGDRAPGAWRGIELHEKAARSAIAGAVVEFAGDEARALLIAAPDVSLTDTTIRDTRGVGLRINGAGGLAAFSGNSFRKIGAPSAIHTTPQAAAGLAGGARFEGGATVALAGGALTKSATWALGAPLVLAERLAVDGEGAARAVLTLSPGTELRMGPEAQLVIGENAPATLKAVGAADAPVTFTAADRREPGSWRGIEVGARGEAELQRAVLEFAGAGDAFALSVREGALALRDTTFRSNLAGVLVTGDPARITAFADNKFAATQRAALISAALVGSLGEGNAFEAGARISVQSGSVKTKSTWLAQGAPLELLGPIQVDGADLTLDAGLEVLARPEASFEVGTYEPAALLAIGTAAAPITLGAQADVWPGVALRGHARRSRFEHVVLVAVGDEEGVWVDSGVEADLQNVSCSRCKTAVVGWACGARVSSSMILAEGGTPTTETKPSGC